MKIKRVAQLVALMVSLMLLSGCQLALEGMGAENVLPEDRLIGVFITLDRRFPDPIVGEAELLRLLAGGKGAGEARQEKFYATLVETTVPGAGGTSHITHEYVFPEMEGISFFAATVPATENSESYVTTGSDNAVSDVQMGLHYTDEEDRHTLEGTIHVSHRLADSIFYFNPVYQEAGGAVYAVPGNGSHFGGTGGEGPVFSLALEEKSSIKVNGEERTTAASVKVSVARMYEPESIRILELDANSRLLARAEYTPGALPEDIFPRVETEYLIVETSKEGVDSATPVTRAIFGKDDATLQAFYCRPDGICVKQTVALNWPD